MMEWRKSAAEAANSIRNAVGDSENKPDDTERLILGALIFGAANALAVREGLDDLSLIGDGLTEILCSSLELERDEAAEYVRFYTQCTNPDFCPDVYNLIDIGVAASHLLNHPEQLSEMVESVLSRNERIAES